MDSRFVALEQRIAALEAQLAALTARTPLQTQGTRLIAPVEVVTAEGLRVLTIHQKRHDTNISVYNTVGHPVATLGVDGTEAGYISIRNAEGVLVAYLDVETAGARLIVQDHTQKGGVVLFGGDSGSYDGGGMNILHTAGGVSIALSSEADGGKLVIYDGQANEQELLILPPQQS